MSNYNPDDFTPIETSPYIELTDLPSNQSPDNPWLPKTDWSRDGIIANEDSQ